MNAQVIDLLIAQTETIKDMVDQLTGYGDKSEAQKMYMYGAIDTLIDLIDLSLDKANVPNGHALRTHSAWLESEFHAARTKIS